jgi:hypothetical protein
MVSTNGKKGFRVHKIGDSAHWVGISMARAIATVPAKMTVIGGFLGLSLFLLGSFPSRSQVALGNEETRETASR